MKNYNNERFAHPYHLWEDYHNGMYEDEISLDRINKAKNILGNPKECKRTMQRVLKEWKYASETNLLTDIKFSFSGDRAWLGAACCSIECGCNVAEVRNAWWLLTDEQRDTANAIADKLIEEYQHQYFDYQLTLF